jgi:hypothetical protein
MPAQKERRAELGGRNCHWIVPGRDDPDDADRPPAGADRATRAVNLFETTGEPHRRCAQTAHGVSDLGLRLLDRLSDLGGDQAREPIRRLFERRRPRQDGIDTVSVVAPGPPRLRPGAASDDFIDDSPVGHRDVGE